ncbi:MAG: LacI family DNA-binding transcriptional regulator, partial [Bacteroidetes bacterium]|nr:LacI family DNA-binding transcriptional regulator [Bacteroidota bacterium]
MKKLSLKDIARHFNVSAGTISYILNGKSVEKRVSKQLTENVLSFVKEKGYKPNMLAKGLRTGKTHIICLMVEDIADHFFSAVAGHLETLAYEKGYKIVYCSTKNNEERAKDLILTFEQGKVDGFIIVPPSGIEQEIKTLQNLNIPFVLFDRYLPNIKATYVGMDNFESSVKAVEHLFGQGFRNIAFITLDSDQTQMRERLIGYESTLMRHKKLPLVKSFRYSLPMHPDIVDEIMKFLGSFPQIDAVFFATNYLAIAGLKA